MGERDIEVSGIANDVDLAAIRDQIIDALGKADGMSRAFVPAIEIVLSQRWHAGKLLNQAKAVLPHGKFLIWLKQNLPEVTDRSARRYMRLFRKWTDVSDMAADLRKRVTPKMDRLLDENSLLKEESNENRPRNVSAVRQAHTAALTLQRRVESLAGSGNPWPDEALGELVEVLDQCRKKIEGIRARGASGNSVS